jgi:hypothetical protein
VKAYVIAGIETFDPNDDSHRYLHYVNVSGVDANGRPIVADTSTRGRTALEDREVLRSLEIIKNR